MRPRPLNRAKGPDCNVIKSGRDSDVPATDLLPQRHRRVMGKEVERNNVHRFPLR